MRQWEVFLFPFERELPHPAVIISNDERCQKNGLGEVNALICTSARLNREAKKHEIILNGADGLDWKTAVRCNLSPAKSGISGKTRCGLGAAPHCHCP